MAELAHSTLSDSQQIDAVAEFLQQQRRVFVLTGAGVSTASGIPDYRDQEGEWKQQRPVLFQDFIKEKITRQRYWARSLLGWSRFSKAKPNASHQALVKLEAEGFIQQLVTQNVDGLHQRAGHKRVIDLHGRLDMVSCLACHYQLMRSELQQQLVGLNPAFLNHQAAIGPDGDAQLEGVDFSRFQIPDCPRCNDILKPNVVFFGENVPKLRVELALQQLQQAQGVLVIGSSLMVFSGYRFCRAAFAQKKPIAAINLGKTRADAELSLKVNQRCGEVLIKLLQFLNL